MLEYHAELQEYVKHLYILIMNKIILKIKYVTSAYNIFF
jgi:hypothetical protein